MNRNARLSLESLEQREVPATDVIIPVGTIPAGISLNAQGILHIVGDARKDEAGVWLDNGEVHAGLTQVQYKVVAGNVVPFVVHTEKAYALQDVKKISFNGLGDSDTFINETSIPCTALGGAGDDVLTGGHGVDFLSGGAGWDSLEGREGDDILSGGIGGDVYLFKSVRNTLGFDTINEAASPDSDTIDFSGMTTSGVTINLGTMAVQTVVPDYLSVKLSSWLGIDNVEGSNSDDHIIGNIRANAIHANGGNDTVAGAAGADSIWGGAGDDILHGDSGNDVIRGESGNDIIHGSTGDDTIDTGSGDNEVSDGTGNDKVDFSQSSVGVNFETDGGNDTVTGSQFDDVITGSLGKDNISAGSGNDTAYGGGGSDQLSGGNGDDQLFGGPGNNTLLGGAGVDHLEGSTGNDEMHGGTGNDELFGGGGTDNLSGDDGNDSLDAGPGRDTMDGGDGTDQLFASRGDETLSNGEHVEITVPDGSPQTDGWSCGPNSGSRLLRSYGFNVSYEQLRTDAQHSNIISDFGLGTPPPDLRDIIKKYKSNTHLQSGADFQSILDRLGEGRPVIALIGWGTIYLPSPIPFFVDSVPEKMHYICLTGFDMASDTLFYMDTNGESKTMSFTEFQDKWDWPAAGAYYEWILKPIGIQKQTMIW
jgi:Ca2+-binding RTX toxin-like protein